VNQLTATHTPASLPALAVAAAQPCAVPGSAAIQLECHDSDGRKPLESCIAARYANRYGARIGSFLPCLLSLTVAGEPRAVAGLRLARQSGLFLEHYLDGPVEQAISRVFHTPVDRGQVVEIGNLASAAPGAATMLFGILAAVLQQAGVRWVACTATPQVRALLDKLRFPSQTIGAADPGVLGDRAGDWGSYYDCRPVVIAGDAEVAATAAAGNRALTALTDGLAAPISRIAAELRAAG
jgi:Thermostable hemolysin